MLSVDTLSELSGQESPPNFLNTEESFPGKICRLKNKPARGNNHSEITTVISLVFGLLKNKIKMHLHPRWDQTLPTTSCTARLADA